VVRCGAGLDRRSPRASRVCWDFAGLYDHHEDYVDPNTGKPAKVQFKTAGGVLTKNRRRTEPSDDGPALEEVRRWRLALTAAL
jgi:hypothetical protein